MARRKILGCCVIASLIAGACASPGADRAVQVTERDSAGVQITSNVLPWPLDSLPSDSLTLLTSIGGDPEDSVHFLQGVSGPVLLSDGRLVLTDIASSSVRMFDAQGAMIRRFGRMGGGPGEFPRGVFGLFRCAGDSLFIREPRRISVFDSSGVFVRYVAVEPTEAGWSPTPVGVSDDCSRFLLTESASQLLEQDGGLVAQSRTRWQNQSGQTSDILFSQTGRRAANVRWMDRERPVPLPWYASGVVAVHDTIMVSGSTSTPEVMLRTASGKPYRIVRWNAPVIDVSARDREQFEERRAAFLELHADERAVFPDLSVLPTAKTKPVFSTVLLSSTGEVWVREYPDSDVGYPGIFRTAATAPVRWLRFNGTDGHFLGVVHVPPDLQITTVNGDTILGITTDEDEVETVRVYRLSTTR